MPLPAAAAWAGGVRRLAARAPAVLGEVALDASKSRRLTSTWLKGISMPASRQRLSMDAQVRLHAQRLADVGQIDAQRELQRAVAETVEGDDRPGAAARLGVRLRTP